MNLVDILIHVDENIDNSRRNEIENSLRKEDGVIAVGNRDNTPHLYIVEYVPEKTSSLNLLTSVKNMGYQAELVGL